jgi:iron-sulfur cluster repair protein YtfE (RIC family)
MSTLTRSEPRADEPAAKPSPSLILELHHRRIDEMLERIAIAIELASWGEARLLFARFRAELEEHIRIEEQVMFPSFEAFTRAYGGPTVVMRAEHADIARGMDALEDRLDREQPAADALELLQALLASHNAKEERVLYPMFERHAPPEAYSALLDELAPLLQQ